MKKNNSDVEVRSDHLSAHLRPMRRLVSMLRCEPTVQLSPGMHADCRCKQPPDDILVNVADAFLILIYKC